MSVRYIDVQGHEVSLDTLTAEFVESQKWVKDILGYTTYNGPLDYEVQQYIQRAIERGQLEMEVWD